MEVPFGKTKISKHPYGRSDSSGLGVSCELLLNTNTEMVGPCRPHSYKYDYE